MEPRPKRQSIESRLDLIEALLRGSDVSAARPLLHELAGARLPRRLVFRFANLARQARLPQLSLCALNRIVRPGKRATSPATPQEKSEYAGALIWFGALVEADRILATIDPKQFPNTLMIRAGACLQIRDSETAIDFTTRFLKIPGSSPFQEVSARIRLAMARLGDGEGAEEARIALDSIEKRHESHLQGEFRWVIPRLRAEIAIHQQDWSTARRHIEELEARKGPAPFPQVAAMLRALAEVFRDPRASAARTQSALARKRLSEAGLWEYLRYFDFQVARRTGNRGLLLSLYFGTPYPWRRGRFLQTLAALPGGDGNPVPELFDRRLTAGSAHPVLLDVIDGSNDASKLTLKPGQLLQRTLQALSRDFYRSPTIAELHETLYPGQYYHPIAAPGRVHQAIYSLRDWIARAKVPLAIEEKDGFYALRAVRNVTLRFRAVESPAPIRTATRVETLLKRFGDEPFAVRDAVTALEVPLRSATRLLGEGVQAGVLERLGTGRATSYRVRR